MASVVGPLSRIGLGTVVHGPTDPDRGVRMAISRSGYVGMVGIGGGCVNVAAALDPARVNESGPAGAVEEVLTDCGLDAPGSLATARWSGTKALSTRLLRPAAFRLLVLGDAAGYTEPFTGEGMSWALEDALEAERLLAPGFGEWDGAIERAWIRSVGSRRRRDWLGRMAARVLRSPRAARAAFGLMERLPGVARKGIGMAQAPLPAVAE
jgi:2-polyprenyl-6-methoxyphenol hydroxylase-like FAD-dependent oxidoreductase